MCLHAATAQVQNLLISSCSLCFSISVCQETPETVKVAAEQVQSCMEGKSSTQPHQLSHTRTRHVILHQRRSVEFWSRCKRCVFVPVGVSVTATPVSV